MKLLPLHEVCELLGVSSAAFLKWRVRPVRRRGRETLYNFDECREEAWRKRLLRPGGYHARGGVPAEVAQAADRIAAEAQRALKRRDIEATTAGIMALQAIAASCDVEV